MTKQDLPVRHDAAGVGERLGAFLAAQRFLGWVTTWSGEPSNERGMRRVAREPEHREVVAHPTVAENCGDCKVTPSAQLSARAPRMLSE